MEGKDNRKEEERKRIGEEKVNGRAREGKSMERLSIE